MLPTNIADRENASTILRECLAAMQGLVCHRVCDQQHLPHSIHDREYDSVCEAVAQCSLVYVLEGTCGCRGPVAAFIGNETSRNAKLQHLIDDIPAADASDTLPRAAQESVAVYIRSMLESCHWLDLVTVPAAIEFADGMFGLSVTAYDNATCHVRLGDAAHRP